VLILRLSNIRADLADPPMRKLRPDEIPRPAPEVLAALPRAPLIVLLDNVRSAHNVGSVLRTADAVRAERVVCCGYTPRPDGPAVLKTALGAESTVPWEAVPDTRAALAHLRARGYTGVALELTDTSIFLDDLPASSFPLALVIGNEVEGVQQGVLDECDLALALPQYGAKHSLNVSVAFGVAAYGLLRAMEQSWSPSS